MNTLNNNYYSIDSIYYIPIACILYNVYLQIYNEYIYIYIVCSTNVIMHVCVCVCVCVCE